ncbi:aminoglycoside phosphotransferase family protein [Stenotrophomonas sp. TWI700]|uniref:aminoglycoside phosphotransferase family protein n=1 Tax=Stenotrophomonas sp. TWI700 TaxID=3136792 RepID=UPI0032080BE7
MHELPATKWQLHRDGDVIETPRGRLWPVRLPDGTPAMLKMSTHAEEPNGHLLLDWWDGDGAARAMPPFQGLSDLLPRLGRGGCWRAL